MSHLGVPASIKSHDESLTTPVRHALRARLARLALALALCAPFVWRLGDEEFHGDESHWTTSGQQAFYLVTSGRFDAPQWREEFYFYSQPQIGKLLIGAALRGAGYSGPTRIYDYDWQRRPWENVALGRVPPRGAVLAARLPGALAGWLACLVLWRIGTALGSGRAGLLAAVLLASHPLWLANARRAGLDAIALLFGLLAAWAVVQAVRASLRRPPTPKGRGGDSLAAQLAAQLAAHAVALPSHAATQGDAPAAIRVDSSMTWRRLWPANGDEGPLLWWLLAGIALGLAAGAKYVGLLTAALAIPVALPSLGGRRRWRTLAGAAAALAVGATVFWAGNPTLYQRPLTQLRVSVDFLATQAHDMRQTSPTFTSLPLVAAEIVDRAIWPIRFPVVVDLTLPEPLIPGSYGTPVVAAGAALALIFGIWDLSRRQRNRPREPEAALLPVAASWTGIVFLLLCFSVPIWWERWHLPLIPPLCLLAGAGLARLAPALALPLPPRDGTGPSRSSRWRAIQVARTALPGGAAAAQFGSALAMEPSFLGRGFGALVAPPWGAALHLAALAVALLALVSLAIALIPISPARRQPWPRQSAPYA